MATPASARIVPARAGIRARACPPRAASSARSSSPLPPGAPHADILETCVGAVASACALIARVRRADAPALVRRKSDATPVTVADYACQALVARRLRDAFPSARLVAEEDARHALPSDPTLRDAIADALLAVGEDPREALEALAACDPGVTDPPATTRASARDEPPAGWFVLDPIDGTEGFLRELTNSTPGGPSGDPVDVENRPSASTSGSNPGPQCCVGLAYVDPDGFPSVGVLGLPLWRDPAGVVVGRVVAAARGGGCHVSALHRHVSDPNAEPNFDWVRVPPPPADLDLASAPVVSSERGAPFAETVVGRGLAAEGRPRVGAETRACCGSLCKYAAVAAGDARLFAQWPTTNDAEGVPGEGASLGVPSEGMGVPGEERDARLNLLGVPARLKTWDHAAGVACVVEAGGTATDLDGAPIRFPVPSRTFEAGGGGVLVAGSSEVHADALRLWTARRR